MLSAKKTRRRFARHARVSACFPGIDPFALTPAQLLGLDENVPAVEARRTRVAMMMHGAKFTPDGLLELLKAETGNEELAQELASNYLYWQKVREAGAQEPAGHEWSAGP